eukprot:1423287-Lingulodinium_polyedra.AAC.1
MVTPTLQEALGLPEARMERRQCLVKNLAGALLARERAGPPRLHEVTPTPSGSTCTARSAWTTTRTTGAWQPLRWPAQRSSWPKSSA